MLPPSSSPSVGGVGSFGGGCPDPTFAFVHSCDLEAHIRVKVGTLEGSLKRLTYEDLLADPVVKYSGRNSAKCPDLMLEAYVAHDEDGRAMHVPVTTAYKHFDVRFEWNEWLKFPIR